jgi:hypothetical protein
MELNLHKVGGRVILTEMTGYGADEVNMVRVSIVDNPEDYVDGEFEEVTIGYIVDMSSSEFIAMNNKSLRINNSVGSLEHALEDVVDNWAEYDGPADAEALGRVYLKY